MRLAGVERQGGMVIGAQSSDDVGVGADEVGVSHSRAPRIADCGVGGLKLHERGHLLEVHAVVHRASSGVAQFMHQHLEHCDRVSQFGRDQNLDGAVSTGGACPAFTDGTTALGIQGEATGHANGLGQGLVVSGKDGTQFLDCGHQPLFAGVLCHVVLSGFVA